MPTAYLKKLAKQGKGSIDSLEKKWDEAKKAAGKDADYGLVTHIFKRSLHIASTSIERLCYEQSIHYVYRRVAARIQEASKIEGHYTS